MDDSKLAEEIENTAREAVENGDGRLCLMLNHLQANQIIAALRRGHEPVPEGFVRTIPDPLGRTICTAEATGQLAEPPPSGEMVMVPREPTAEMIARGYAAAAFPRDPEICVAMYKAMIAAAEASKEAK
jgi:hypothetical protein